MILAILITLATAPAPREPSCVQVRSYVEMFGEAAAVSRARRQGFTQADIDRIRKRCLPRS
jgi:hypothetical protein